MPKESENILAPLPRKTQASVIPPRPRPQHSHLSMGLEGRSEKGLLKPSLSSRMQHSALSKAGISVESPSEDVNTDTLLEESYERRASARRVWDEQTIALEAVISEVPLQESVVSSGPLLPLEQATPRSKEGLLGVVRPWFYRCWLLAMTAVLSWFLLRVQARLDAVPFHPSPWRIALQWAELTWLGPVPLAIPLWLGWFLFAEVARKHPTPIEVPQISMEDDLFAPGPPRPVSLVFRFVTRGDNVDVLRESVIAVHEAFARYPLTTGPYRIEIVSECTLSLGADVSDRVAIYVVPPEYVTVKRSRFKARALAYLQTQVGPRREDWYIYLDEESMIDEALIAGVYRFIIRAQAQVKRKRGLAGLIGQGGILYQGGNWFFRGADALRTADDLGRFRLQYALGVPIFGIHGSYIVVRSLDDARLPFDVGSTNSITEDAAWSLYAWTRGFRFAWVEGYLHEQPPQRIRDFVRQRSRWLSGIRLVLRDTQIPLRYRISLGVFATLWQLSFLPFLVAVAALFLHVAPFIWMRLPADFAWATFLLAYLQGIDVQARYVGCRLQSSFKLRVKRVLSWFLVLCNIWYALLEATGVLYSLKPRQGFFVIHKPRLTSEYNSAAGASSPIPTLITNASGYTSKR